MIIADGTPSPAPEHGIARPATVPDGIAALRARRCWSCNATPCGSGRAVTDTVGEDQREDVVRHVGLSGSLRAGRAARTCSVRMAGLREMLPGLEMSFLSPNFQQ